MSNSKPINGYINGRNGYSDRHTNGHKSQAAGTGTYNPNEPFGNNPFIKVPADVDENPWRLIWKDLGTVFEWKTAKLIPKIALPLGPFISGPLDELYPSVSNIKDLTIHACLLVGQLFFIITLPCMAAIFFLWPGGIIFVYWLLFTLATFFAARLLNGGRTAECLAGLPDGREPVNDEKELWFFINGVATGKNWLQNNLNLLAQTFQREIVGIHNTTYGVLFDLIECLIQRDLDYKTRDIRQARAQIRSALTATATKKVVLILHSQGGIEGSSVIDWLLADLSHKVVSKLEIYTFGNAARRFNNPLVSEKSDELLNESKGGRGSRVIKYIEHYANSGDFVANVGVLNFTKPEAQPYADGNAFSGQVFERKGTGHLLNMHYLNKMFTMVDGEVDNHGNDFMNSTIPVREARKELPDLHQLRRIRDVSRLWKYRNGGKPSD